MTYYTYSDRQKDRQMVRQTDRELDTVRQMEEKDGRSESGGKITKVTEEREKWL